MTLAGHTHGGQVNVEILHEDLNIAGAIAAGEADAQLKAARDQMAAGRIVWVRVNGDATQATDLLRARPEIASVEPFDGKLKVTLHGHEVDHSLVAEVLVRGGNVTSGYFNNEAATAEAFEDGWFHTGDIGELDADGLLRITDRKKDLIKTSGGKYIAPVKIEGMLKAMPMVSEAVVLGDNRKYCTALLVLDEDGVAAWAKRTGNPAEPRHPALLAALQKSLDEVILSYLAEDLGDRK